MHARISNYRQLRQICPIAYITADVAGFLTRKKTVDMCLLTKYRKRISDPMLEGTDIVSNSDMRGREVRRFFKLDETGMSLMRSAMSQLQLSARGYHRVLKLARTIADLVGSEEIQSTHLAEALQYRPKMLA